MKSETGNPYGTSISVVRGIIDVLKIGSGKKTTPDIHFVVSLIVVVWGVRGPIFKFSDRGIWL
jgi:hypothetical protein